VLILDEKTRIAYTRDKGQILIDIRIVCEGSAETDKITFIYDTGAYLTVINKERYEWHGLNKLPRREASIGGYGGSTPGYVFRIPGLVIGKRLLTGVWAYTPKSKDIKQNLLGDNVIEYFRPFQDNLHDSIYFLDNPQPNPYVASSLNFSLACESVMVIDD